MLAMLFFIYTYSIGTQHKLNLWHNADIISIGYILFLDSLTLSKTYTKKAKIKYSILAAMIRITHNKKIHTHLHGIITIYKAG